MTCLHWSPRSVTLDPEDHAQRQGPPRTSEYDDLWRCRYCRRWFVVPVLARDHEQTCVERR